MKTYSVSFVIMYNYLVIKLNSAECALQQQAALITRLRSEVQDLKLRVDADKHVVVDNIMFEDGTVPMTPKPSPGNDEEYERSVSQFNGTWKKLQVCG